MNTLRHCIIILAAALTLAACSTSRKAAGPASAQQADTAWHTLYAPVRLNLSSPVSIGASGRASMVRDSLVHISLRFFGMEVAQVRATADSAWVVDKYHKIYTAMPLDELTARTGISLADVQDILLGQASLTDRLPAVSERVSITAAGYEPTPAGAVADRVDFSARVGRRDITGSIAWDLDKAQWNVPVTAAVASLRGYKFVEPDKLPAALKGL